MKLLKISSKKKATKSGTNVKDATLSSDDAVYEPGNTKKLEPSSPKVKRKKFGLFSKSKSKSTPTRSGKNDQEASTPDTVPENDRYDLTNYNVLSVVPMNEGHKGITTPASLEGAANTEFHATRSFLAQLNAVETKAEPDGSEEEGLELILPMPKYEINEVKIEENDDQINKNYVDHGIENVDNTRITVVENTDKEDVVKNGEDIQKSTEMNDSNNLNEPRETEEENDETDVKKTSAETDVKNTSVETDTTNTSMKPEDKKNVSVLVEVEEAEVEEVQQEEWGFQQGSIATSAVRIWETAFSCPGVDTVDNCSALPIMLQKDLYKNVITRPVDLNNMFDERSGSDFLDDMLNVGYTLIYHISVDEDSWVGRTVSLVFQPGVCSAQTIVKPAIEWNTMAGGKSSFVESKSIGLLDINAIAASNAKEEGEDGEAIKPSSLPIPAKPPTNQKNDVCVSSCRAGPFAGLGNIVGDEFDCFFTITTQDGEIHLFEALDAEDCRRIVAGVRYSARRLSRLLIEGDSDALMSDFYDNSKVPEDAVLTNETILNRLSNAYFDE